MRPARQTADLPLGYPREYVRLVALHDGRSVRIRPVLPGDAPALAEAIESADADTIRHRDPGNLGRHRQVLRAAARLQTRITSAIGIQ